MSHKEQHTIPKAYLKYFASNSFLHFIELRNQYRTGIQREGSGHRVFKKSKYYDFNGNKGLEFAFGRIESTNYELAISNLQSGSNLGYETKQLLIEWIMIQKLRCTYFRDNFSNLFSWIEQTKYGLIHGREEMEKKISEFKNIGKEQSKAFQLSSFLDKKDFEDLRKAFSVNFLNHHWTILTSEQSQFITSDNPGFSISFSPHILRLGLSPLSSQFNIDKKTNCIHCFPLTSKMALKLTPILEGDLPELNESEMKKFILSDIKFRKATDEDIEMINEVTYQTAYELVISEYADQLMPFEK